MLHHIVLNNTLNSNIQAYASQFMRTVGARKSTLITTLNHVNEIVPRVWHGSQSVKWRRREQRGRILIRQETAEASKVPYSRPEARNRRSWGPRCSIERGMALKQVAYGRLRCVSRAPALCCASLHLAVHLHDAPLRVPASPRGLGVVMHDCLSNCSIANKSAPQLESASSYVGQRITTDRTRRKSYPRPFEKNVHSARSRPVTGPWCNSSRLEMLVAFFTRGSGLFQTLCLRVRWSEELRVFLQSSVNAFEICLGR